jgi:dihydroorotate dehydrogenase electron transfer subunit
LFLTRVIENVPLCREHWRFTVEIGDFPQAEPGQFVQILCSEPDRDSASGSGAFAPPRAASSCFLRRPFSIGGLRRNGRQCEMDFIHRVVGPGTHWLSQLRPGDAVSMLGPLGRPFAVPADRPLALLVGGGVGMPPLIWLAEALRAAGKQILAFCGARCADLIPLTTVPGVIVSGRDGSPAYEEFSRYGAPVIISTDDGSLGAAGRIPDIFQTYLDRHPNVVPSAVVYTCGPTPMMKATARVCEAVGLPCQVCLERVMACGMGTCQSCVVPVRDMASEGGWRYRLCCTDGPVFENTDVIWDE